MAVQLSEDVRTARLEAIETAIGATAKLAIFSGAVPGDCASGDPAGELARMTLPADYMNAAAAGTKTIKGAWTCSAAGAGLPGVALSFRIYANDGTTCHIQGTVGMGSGDLALDNTSIASGQTVTVVTFTLTDGNA